MASNPSQIAETTYSQGSKIYSVMKKLGAVLILAVLVTAILIVPGMQRETQRSEAYLPQLEAAAQHSPYDGRLLGLLGGRLAEAHEYSPASVALQHAVAAGENNPELWLTLAACAAATGDPESGAYLKVGARSAPSPAIADALARVQALGSDAPPNTLARAICPQGAAPLLARYGAGSILSRWADWSGRRHPESSGFSTRQKWAADAPDDAQAQRLWGEALTQNRRFREADPVLQQAVTLAPDSPKVHLAIADLRDRSGQPGQAILEYIAALKLRPHWPSWPWTRGARAASARVGSRCLPAGHGGRSAIRRCLDRPGRRRCPGAAKSGPGTDGVPNGGTSRSVTNRLFQRLLGRFKDQQSL